MDEKTRLEITSVDGAACLYYQFYYSEEEKKLAGDAYTNLGEFMYRYLRRRYAEEGLKTYNDESFYKVKYTDNHSGFCLSIDCLFGIRETESIQIITDALRLICSFDPEKVLDENQHLDSEVLETINQTKSMAAALLKQIQDEHLYTFSKEYWNPHE